MSSSEACNLHALDHGGRQTMKLMLWCLYRSPSDHPIFYKSRVPPIVQCRAHAPNDCIYLFFFVCQTVVGILLDVFS